MKQMETKTYIHCFDLFLFLGEMQLIGLIGESFEWPKTEITKEKYESLVFVEAAEDWMRRASEIGFFFFVEKDLF